MTVLAGAGVVPPIVQLTLGVLVWYGTQGRRVVVVVVRYVAVGWRHVVMSVLVHHPGYRPLRGGHDRGGAGVDGEG